MTENNDKIRSLFLTALMVFSVFAGTVALSGAAAAANEDPVFHVHGTSTNSAYVGQTVTVTGLDAGESDYEVRLIEDTNTTGYVTDSQQASAFVTEGSGGEGQGYIEFETSNLDEGDYYVVGGELDERRNPDETLEVTSQWINVDFGSNNVTDDESVDLEVDSNRPRFALNITADNLDAEDSTPRSTM